MRFFVDIVEVDHLDSIFVGDFPFRDLQLYAISHENAQKLSEETTDDTIICDGISMPDSFIGDITIKVIPN